MRRKIDRYKRNREFRKNPTRSRVFFPYTLPFVPDFRIGGYSPRKPEPPIDPGYDGDEDYEDDRVDRAVEAMQRGVEYYRAWRRAQQRSEISTQDLALGVLQALTPNRPRMLPYYRH